MFDQCRLGITVPQTNRPERGLPAARALACTAEDESSMPRFFETAPSTRENGVRTPGTSQTEDTVMHAPESSANRR